MKSYHHYKLENDIFQVKKMADFVDIFWDYFAPVPAYTIARPWAKFRSESGNRPVPKSGCLSRNTFTSTLKKNNNYSFGARATDVF